MRTADYPAQMTRDCPSCAAKVGEQCRRRNGEPRVFFHARRSNPSRPKDGYWLRPFGFGHCSSCEAPLAETPTVYRHDPKVSLCRGCADALGIEYQESRAWQEQTPC